MRWLRLSAAFWCGSASAGAGWYCGGDLERFGVLGAFPGIPAGSEAGLTPLAAEGKSVRRIC